MEVGQIVGFIFSLAGAQQNKVNKLGFIIFFIDVALDIIFRS